MSYADLHIHSTHSDGTLSVGEILETAVRNGVGLLSVTDHEVLSGSRELIAMAKDCPVEVIAGVELSAMAEGIYLHILGYGIDLCEPRICEISAHCRSTLDKMSDDLIALLAREDERVNAQEYALYTRNERNGGWKGIDYLAHKGVVPFPMAGAKLYGQYGVTYEKAGFPSLSDVVSAIHGAGGKAVVAHAYLANTDNVPAMVETLFAQGVDGAECHYPKHSTEQTQVLLSLCRAHHAIITAGSDCHGTFTGGAIGCTKTEQALLNLKDIRKVGGGRV